MIGALALLPHMVLMLVAGPLLAGLVGQAHPAQPWRDLRRLFHKPGLWPESAGPFGVAPVISLGATLAAALLVPSFTLGMATTPIADLVLIILLLALSSAALIVAAFDAGTGSLPLGGQRQAVLILAAMPGLLVLVLIVAAASGTSLLDPAITLLRDAGLHAVLGLAGAGGALTLAALDAPGPDSAFAGRDLAVVAFAAQLRRVTVLSLLAALLVPFGMAQAGSGPEAWLTGAACWAVKIAVLGLAADALRRVRAAPRVEQGPELALLGLLVALIAAALFFAGQGTT